MLNGGLHMRAFVLRIRRRQRQSDLRRMQTFLQQTFYTKYLTLPFTPSNQGFTCHQKTFRHLLEGFPSDLDGFRRHSKGFPSDLETFRYHVEGFPSDLEGFRRHAENFPYRKEGLLSHEA